MKLKRILLTADRRGNEIILYKKFIGKKLFLKEPTEYDKEKGTKPTVFIKKVKLLDLITKTYIEEEVFLKVVSVHKRIVEVEVA